MSYSPMPVLYSLVPTHAKVRKAIAAYARDETGEVNQDTLAEWFADQRTNDADEHEEYYQFALALQAEQGPDIIIWAIAAAS